MIPLCCLDTVEYTDEDKTKWIFKPFTGDLEREYIKLMEAIREENEESVKMLDTLIEKVVLKCSPVSNPDYFKRRKIVKEMIRSEKLKIIFNIWQKANDLSDDEKKT